MQTLIIPANIDKKKDAYIAAIVIVHDEMSEMNSQAWLF